MPGRKGSVQVVTSILTALVLFLNPLLYDEHLISVPHVFCPVHEHLESRADPVSGEPLPGEPADSGDHDDEDAACLAVSVFCAGEQGQAFELPPVLLSCDGPVVVPAVQAQVESEVLLNAPKHSPPVL